MSDPGNVLAAVGALYALCSESDSLRRLAEVARLEPAKDFEQADLRELNVAGEDLTPFSFRGADLRDSDLRGAQLRRRALEGALLTGAQLEGIVWTGPLETDRLIFGSDNAWSVMSRQTLEHWMSKVAPVDGKYRMSWETTRGFRRALPFYAETVELLAFTDENWVNKNLVVYYLQYEDELFRLNGTSRAIHELNGKAPLELSEKNILDYLRFYCLMVRGQEGPFLVLESVEDSLLPEELDGTSRHTIEQAAQPAVFEGLDDEGNFCVAAVIMYSNALFLSNFSIQPSGMVEMFDDETIAVDMSVRVNAPIA
ncbi:Pentapeptide repeat-containing protein [Salipiger thiooxidans]|uniref:Pentapeptide repeat-containing protein n=1 Tax=Salipiger thiooxidans TaxID=282683 RepID=A0A1G7LVC4_9RHOB|nr:pentapeptide repeat-containing protein [Salipiger thiooxidans]SDF52899.1 Pentapeptide repeat-containing protein [Salipiger thiooxidans]